MEAPTILLHTSKTVETSSSRFATLIPSPHTAFHSHQGVLLAQLPQSAFNHQHTQSIPNSLILPVNTNIKKQKENLIKERRKQVSKKLNTKQYIVVQ